MELSFFGLAGFPMVEPGDDLAQLITDSVKENKRDLIDGDVIVIAQKVVSKAENRYLDLRTIEPSERAIELSRRVQKDPRKVQAILNESNEVVRAAPGVLIVEQKNGFVQANAGIDQSNIEFLGIDPEDLCLLLPENSDQSAAKIRRTLERASGKEIGVIINDSLGRPWRVGTLGLAIGVSGFTALEDYVGGHDIYGRELQVTQVGAADELAAGASLVMGQTTEKTPVVLVRGYHPKEPMETELKGVRPLIRDREFDLFR